MSQQTEKTPLADLLESRVPEEIAEAFTRIAQEPGHPLLEKEYLFLGQASLQVLPKEIGLFKALNRLVLSGNQLKSLPDELASLEALKELTLANNPLEDLPASFAELKISNLNLDGAKFRAFPVTVCGITRLEILSMRRCFFIRSLPEEIGQLKQLQSFSLASGQLKTLPPSFGELTKLQTLNLADNNLRSLPETISQLDKLEKMDLSRNQLKVLPRGLEGLVSLKELDLRHNKFLPVEKDEIQEQLPECQIRF